MLTEKERTIEGDHTLQEEENISLMDISLMEGETSGGTSSGITLEDGDNSEVVVLLVLPLFFKVEKVDLERAYYIVRGSIEANKHIL